MSWMDEPWQRRRMAGPGDGPVGARRRVRRAGFRRQAPPDPWFAFNPYPFPQMYDPAFRGRWAESARGGPDDGATQRRAYDDQLDDGDGWRRGRRSTEGTDRPDPGADPAEQLGPRARRYRARQAEGPAPFRWGYRSRW
jgi:hypothetical protein